MTARADAARSNDRGGIRRLQVRLRRLAPPWRYAGALIAAALHAGVLLACSGGATTDAAPAQVALGIVDVALGWEHILERARPTVAPGPAAHLIAAVAAMDATGGAASDASLVELEAWARAGGGLPAPTGSAMEIVARGMRWFRLGEDLLTSSRLRERAADPLLYLAYRMRGEGPTAFEVTLGQSLALRVAEATTSAKAMHLAPTDREVVRALAAEAVFSLHVSEQAAQEAVVPGDALETVAVADVEALRRFYVAVLARPSGDGSRAAWLFHIDQLCERQTASPSLLVRRVAASMREVAARMFATIDAFAAAIAEPDARARHPRGDGG